jgi:hypothetical protein
VGGSVATAASGGFEGSTVTCCGDERGWSGRSAHGALALEAWPGGPWLDKTRRPLLLQWAGNS